MTNMINQNPFVVLQEQLLSINEQQLKLTTEIQELRKFLEYKSTAQIEDAFIDISEASKIIHLAPPTIYGLIHTKKIPHYKRGKRLQFSKAELIEWVKEGKR